MKNDVISPNSRNKLMMHHLMLNGVVPQTKHLLSFLLEKKSLERSKNQVFGDIFLVSLGDALTFA
jgi:hypothetical protein